MLKNPAQLFIEHRIGGVVNYSLVANKFYGFLNPAPAVFRQRTCHRNIICHIPGQISGRAGKTRLQLGDPRCELHHFKVIALLLQRGGAQPQDVGQQTAETAQRNSGENHDRRSIADLSGIIKIVCSDTGVKLLFRLIDRNQYQN